MHNINKIKKAFTLIEFLIVIAIIGILFIVLVSKVDFATDKAKATGVQTDFRSFQMAFEQVARENAGFNTFGWDTGDNAGAIPSGYAFETTALKDVTIGDGIRNSYDQGDKNLNGKQDTGEVFTGRKIYTETWTEVYTLTKPGTTGLDADAVFALESAINANLDPKLHITINADGKITMANQARDPWKNEYHGVYISQAERDNGADRGAIIMYSNGANGKCGSAHDIANGVVTVSVPGNNKDGQDDYALTTIYTYEYGYGEVKTNSFGFIKSQGPTVSNNGTNGGSIIQPGNNNGFEYNDITGMWEKTETIVWNENAPVENVISFVGGKFESSFYYSNAAYDTVTYTVSETKVKCPPDGGMVSILCDDLNTMLQTQGYKGMYHAIVCGDNVTVSLDGINQTLMNFAWYVCLDENDYTMENMIYTAAFYKKYAEGFDDIVIVKWDASQERYVPIDCDNEIDAVTNFTKTVNRKVTKTVVLTPATTIENLVFVPIGDMQAEEGMTWQEWLNSAYNTTGFSNTIIRSGDGSIVPLNSIIEAGETYGIYDAPKTILYEPGLYQTGSDYTAKTYSWENLLNSGLITVTNGILRGSQNIEGDLIIPDGVGIVELQAFAYSNLTSVSIPSSVKKIAESSFYSCKNLVSVELNEGLETIGDVAFRGCDKLEGLTIPNSVTSMPTDANQFLFCQSMRYLNLGSGLTTVPAVYGEYDIFVIPEGYIDMGRPSFFKCSAMYVPATIQRCGATEITGFANKSFYGNVDVIYFAGTEEQWNAIEWIEYVTCQNVVFNTPYEP